MKNKNKGVILIYVLFLVTLTISFATILLNNNSYLFNINEYYDIELKLNSNINSDGQILVDINREFNSNGSGFIDNISCPSGTSISMSGTINRADIGSILINSGSVYCEASYLLNPVYIYFNSGMTDFVEAEYSGSIVSLTNGVGDTFFGDTEGTLIDFSLYSITTPDFYDDDYDSDNYMVTSTGNTATGTYYLSGFQDDDTLGRRSIYGYVAPEVGYKKVFWNTDDFLKVIDDNTNNNDSLNMKIGNTNTGYLYFDIDKQFDMKISVFDKVQFNETNELILKDILDINTNSGTLGYLEKDGTFALTSSGTTSYNFKFNSNTDMYAIFIKSTGTGTLLYKISGESDSGTGVYITPIDDSDSGIVRYAGNEILISDKGDYITKESEVIYKK